MLRLNSIQRSVFEAKDAQNYSVKLNSAEGASAKTIKRRDIVATGRLVACEFIGNLINNDKNAIEKYNSKLKGVTYEDLSRAHTEKKLLFCAAQVSNILGKEAPKTMDELRANESLMRNNLFLQVMAAIDVDVLTPIFFDVFTDVGMGLMQLEPVGVGRTKQIDIRSNDVFLWEDSSWGSGRSTSKNYLYQKTITLTPKVFSTNATIKWYQDVVSGDAGRYYAAIMLGLYNKMYAMVIKAMKNATTGNTYIPAGLTSETYSTQNWIAITDLVAAANGVSVNNLMAIGTRSALSNLLPVDGTGGAMTGLQYGLGEAWFYNGYLPKAGGVDLFPVSPVIVPGTQNSTLDTIDTGNDIYILAKGLYRPLYGVYMEGTPITLTATPGGADGAQGTADFTIDINVGAMFDIKPVFASKVGKVTSVYGSSD